MVASPINPDEFVALVKPPLEQRDLGGLLSVLRSNWTADQIAELLCCGHGDARKVAALALALVGRKCCVGAIAAQLKDPDPMTNQIAEHALWSIWFRCGTPTANALVARGAGALERRQFDEAIEHFDAAIEADPTFAEAYNQRAIAYYLSERYEPSLLDCRQAIDRMPCHFGALSGMGHCYAHLGHLPEALRSYEKALEVNPHLYCVAELVKELRQRINGEDTADAGEMHEGDGADAAEWWRADGGVNH